MPSVKWPISASSAGPTTRPRIEPASSVSTTSTPIVQRVASSSPPTRRSARLTTSRPTPAAPLDAAVIGNFTISSRVGLIAITNSTIVTSKSTVGSSENTKSSFLNAFATVMNTSASLTSFLPFLEQHGGRLLAAVVEVLERRRRTAPCRPGCSPRRDCRSSRRTRTRSAAAGWWPRRACPGRS